MIGQRHLPSRMLSGNQVLLANQPRRLVLFCCQQVAATDPEDLPRRRNRSHSRGSDSAKSDVEAEAKTAGRSWTDNASTDSTKSLATGASRRSVLKGLLGLGGATAVGSLLGSEVDARRSSITITTPPPTTTPAPCRPGFAPCTTNVTGCCAVCSGNTPVTCGLECCATADQCCDGECCATGSACLTKAFPNGNQAEETCCPVSQTCDNECCDGTCFTPLGTSLTGYDRDCCPAEATYCAGTGEFTGQGLCCTGPTPDCCVRDGEPICINEESQCCLNRNCPDSTDTCERGVCRRSDQTCILRPVCEGDDICCGNDVCGQCCQDGDCPDDDPGSWRCVDLTCVYCPSVEEYCSGRCGEINTVNYCGNYDCSAFCDASCNTCENENVCTPKAAGTACDGPCGACDGAGACGFARNGTDCIGEDGVCCEGSCTECCSNSDCLDRVAGITEALCVDGACACTPDPVTCQANRDCGHVHRWVRRIDRLRRMQRVSRKYCVSSQDGFNGSCTCYYDCAGIPGKQCGDDGCGARAESVRQDRAASTSNASTPVVEPVMRAVARSAPMAVARCSATPKRAQSVALESASFPDPTSAAAVQPVMLTLVWSAPLEHV